jgi:hypothetical protein
MLEEYSDLRRLAFQKQMVARVHKLVDNSEDPDQFAGVHMEYYYSTSVNFGRLFKHGCKRPSPMENAYLEARQNGSPAVLIVSRPHDNYYILAADADLSHLCGRCPIIRWMLFDPNEEAHHDMVMMNLKDWLVYG